jgi:ABC-type branched-subunit amino acid transport system substrate-binding protein
VPLVTQAELVPNALGENVFTVNVGPNREGQILARFVVAELRASKVAMITDGRLASLAALSEAFSREFAKAGGKRVEPFAYKRKDAQEKTSADLGVDVKRMQPDAVVYLGTAADLGNVRRLLQNAGVKAPLLFGGGANQLAALLADRDASDGVYCATAYVHNVDTAQNQGFALVFRERFHEAPDIHAALAYDGIRLLLEALSRADSLNGAGVRAKLADPDFRFESLTGQLSFDSHHLARRAAFIISLHNGEARIIKRYEAEEK